MGSRLRLAYPLLLVVLLTACEAGGTPAPSASGAPATGAARTSAAAGQAGQGGCPIAAAGPVDAGSVLVPGPVNGVPRSTAPPGERLTVTATVLTPDCRPAAGARLTLWHTDSSGKYGPGQNDCCYFGGEVVTDANGRFRLDTIVPARYPEPGAPPSHIHFEMRHDAGSLDTEIIFGRGGQVAPVAPANVIPVELTPVDSGSLGVATFVLR
jgi:protocatechuate 3,4-dioxygenase beta subunit